MNFDPANETIEAVWPGYGGGAPHYCILVRNGWDGELRIEVLRYPMMRETLLDLHSIGYEFHGKALAETKRVLSKPKRKAKKK